MILYVSANTLQSSLIANSSAYLLMRQIHDRWIRNLKVPINYFGLLLLKATYRDRPLNYYFCLSFTKTYFSSHRSEKETSFLKQLNLVETSITKSILLVSIEFTDDIFETIRFWQRLVAENAPRSYSHYRTVSFVLIKTPKKKADYAAIKHHCHLHIRNIWITLTSVFENLRFRCQPLWTVFSNVNYAFQMKTMDVSDRCCVDGTGKRTKKYSLSNEM